MKKSVLFCCIISLSALSCNKNTDYAILPDGTYTGTFQRQIGGNGQISNVTIIFSPGKWTGQSQIEKYPALCHGTFKTIEPEIINFTNDCVWTTEFDGTLVLNGEYKIKVMGNKIEFSKEYNSRNLKDIYSLTKQ